MSTRDELVSKIEGDKSKFPPLIDYIRYPYFRNLALNSRIEFNSPYTVFVGQNGCGKSSALQSLYGAPHRSSLGDYWFTTVVDPINEPTAEEHRHCFIYSHSGQGNEKEVLFRRIFKDGKPDLWDTSEAMALYGMTGVGTRTSAPIKKNVIYINFRAAQNAFEKKFHEERPPAAKVQDFLRKRSRHLANGLQGKFKDSRFKPKSHDAVKTFHQGHLNDIGKILGRKYLEAKMLRHRFFDIMGYSVYMKTANAQYSEAFAGSGEFAVFLLVSEISSAADGSLLLLDEPETSLHPGAQRNLQLYLLEQCQKKKLQVVLCSHSPAMIEGLPETWIKVFMQECDGKFGVLNKAAPHEALHFIGEPLRNKMVVRVEDRLGKLILTEVSQKSSSTIPLPFDVIFFPGGNNQMMKDAVVYSSESPSKYMIIFDKDVEPTKSWLPPADTPHNIYNDPVKSVEYLKQELIDRAYTGMKFPKDSNAENTFQERDAMSKYINFLISSVHYFPHDVEDMIWDEQKAQILYDQSSEKHMTFAQLKALIPKDRYVELARAGATDPMTPTAEEIAFIHRMFVREWVDKKDANYKAIVELIATLSAKC